MSKWKLCSRKKPTKEGIYLIADYCPDDESDNSVFPGTAAWHFKGDAITYREPAGNTPEERLRSILMSEPIIAWKDGFYEVSDGEVWILEPYMWRELPKAPSGMTYNDIHLDD